MPQADANQQPYEPYRSPPVNARGRAYDPDATDDERTFALFMHLSLLGHLLVPIIIIAAPIIMWAVKKNDSPFLDDHGREAINFQISLVIWSIVLGVLSIPLGFITCGIGFGVAFVPYILALVGMIQASVAANRGEFYRYPMSFRFL